MIVQVEQLSFSFPQGWDVVKYDDTSFYRNQFGRMWQSIRAVDLLAVSDNNVAYLVEVKDYRLATDAAPTDLPLIIAQKIFDTLAALLPCSLNANETVEQDIAAKACGCKKLVVVLHLEQPNVQVGIFRPYNRADLQQKLRQILKPIDAHPWVLQKSKMGTAAWTVT